MGWDGEEDEDLFADEEDKRYLESLSDYLREKELARRFEEKLRQRQREELLGEPSRHVRPEAAGLSRGSPAASQKRRRATVDAWSAGEDGKPRENDHERDDNERDFLEVDESLVGTRKAGLAYGDLPRDHGAYSGGNDTAVWDIAETNIMSPGKAALLTKRVEKSLASLTASLLEAIRVGPSSLKAMEEHPRIASYLQGCLVFLPGRVLEDAIQNEGATGHVSYVSGRIVGIEPPEEPRSSFLFDLMVIPIGSLKSERISVATVVDKPFDDQDVEWLRGRLRMSIAQCRRLVESFASMAKEKAQQLREFTFTESDVAEILRRKKQQKLHTLSSGDEEVSVSSVAYRTCYQHREEVATQVEQIKLKLQEDSVDSSVRKHLSKVLGDLETEMYYLNRQVAQFQTASSWVKDTSMTNLRTLRSKASEKRRESDLFICGGRSGRPSLKESGPDAGLPARLPSQRASQPSWLCSERSCASRLPLNDDSAFARAITPTAGPESLLRLIRAAATAASSEPLPGSHTGPLNTPGVLPLLLWQKPISVDLEMGILTTALEAFEAMTAAVPSPAALAKNELEREASNKSLSPLGFPLSFSSPLTLAHEEETWPPVNRSQASAQLDGMPDLKIVSFEEYIKTAE